MHDEIGALVCLLLGEDAERPDLGEAVAAAILRLGERLAATAAVADQHHAARRAERHHRQVEAPVTQEDAGRLADRIAGLADHHGVEVTARRTATRTHRRRSPARRRAQDGTGRGALGDAADDRQGLAIASLAEQDESEEIRRSGLRLRAKAREHEAEEGHEDGGTHG